VKNGGNYADIGVISDNVSWCTGEATIIRNSLSYLELYDESCSCSTRVHEFWL